MLSLRRPGRSPLTRAIARLLIAVLVASLVPASAGASHVRPSLIPSASGSSSSVVAPEPSKLTKSAFGELLAHTGTDPQPYAFTGEPYDPNSSFQYHRSRWMSPGSGRFVGMDRFRGAEGEPASLHKYGYAHGDPQNQLDPTGLLSNLLFGRLVHAAVGAHFTAQGGDRLADRSINTVLDATVPYLGLLRPDLVDRDTGEVWEIKPFGRFVEGEFQLALYLQILNGQDPEQRPWITAGYGYIPPRMIPLPGIAVAIVFPPIDGIILYNVVAPQDVAQEMAAVTAAGVLAAAAFKATAGSTSIMVIAPQTTAAILSGSFQGAAVTQQVGTATINAALGKVA